MFLNEQPTLKTYSGTTKPVNTNTLYRKNRENLMRALPDGLIIVASGAEKSRNSDVDYRFRQDSDFLYLTGITHPHHALVLDPKSKTSHLIIPDRDTRFQIWVGRQMTTQEAKKTHGVNEAHYASDFPKVLAKLRKKYRKIYCGEASQGLLKKWQIAHPKKSLGLDFRVALNELRIRKSPIELDFMRIANRISHDGHVTAMRATRPGLHEFQIQAAMERDFLDGGAIHNAYSSIVAAGANAAILHYHENNAVCGKDDLLLIDAGCEWHGYAADVTRTYPVSGKFSREQATIYEIVLAAQKQCIEIVKPGVSVLDLHRLACKIIAEGLAACGILKGDPEDAVKNDAHAIFFPHGIGHFLGLDVHDVGAKDPKAKPVKNKPKHLRASRVLEAGFVVTVEPGIYFIDAHFKNAATRKKYAKWIDWKIAESYRCVGGIRIEDDIVVTRNGYENLTTVPKEISDIEKLMAT